MQKSSQRRIFLSTILIFFIIVTIVSYIYISSLNRTVSDNITLTMEEMSQHDMKAIKSYLESSWGDLGHIHLRFRLYDCQTDRDIQEHLNLERASSNFSHLYLLDENGNLYNDQYQIYTNNTHVLENIFKDKRQKIVTWYSEYGIDPSLPDEQMEMLLYGIQIDLQAAGHHFTGLLGLTNIDILQNRLRIDSFQSRGYSSVIDKEGHFITKIDHTSNDTRSTIYEQMEGGVFQDQMNAKTIRQKLEAEETFTMSYTNVSGISKVVLFQPLSETDWYFIMTVPSKVFSDRSRRFLAMSMGMLAVVVLMILIMMILLSRSSRRTVAARAEAHARSEFLSNMSHEIRTPLNGLIGLNHLMKIHIKEPERIEEYVNKSSNTAQYLLSLVNDILDMSKFQAGKIDLLHEPLDVEKLIDSVASMQRENIISRGIEFIVEKDIRVPFILGDEIRIQQVLMNIVGNAAKFTPTGGHIRLALSQTMDGKTHVINTFTVEDTGIGMSEEFQEHIFESFSQERNKNNNSIKGTGLGMSISYLLMQAMGGNIAVSSKLGEGSTFTVTLRSEKAASVLSSEEISSVPSAHVDKSHLHILVAEDNELNAEILLEILHEEGFPTTLAVNGQEAADIFAASEPGTFQVILMDMQMPVMDGCQAAQTIRAMDRPDAKTIPIYACTANTFLQDREKAMQSGMNDFLAKPVDVSLLIEKLNSFL